MRTGRNVRFWRISDAAEPETDIREPLKGER